MIKVGIMAAAKSPRCVIFASIKSSDLGKTASVNSDFVSHL